MKLLSKILSALLVCLIFGVLPSCVPNPSYSKELFKDMPLDTGCVLLTDDYLCVGDRQLLRDEITYDDRKCVTSVLTAEGMYAFAAGKSASDPSDILFIPYDTMTPEPVGSIPARVRGTKYADGCIFLYAAPEKEDGPIPVYVYNVSSRETYFLDSGVDGVPLGKDELFWSERYEILSVQGEISINDKQSGETRQIEKSMVKDCPEGRTMWDKIGFVGISDITVVGEQNGTIYLGGTYLDDGFLGYPCHVFILSYDFDTEEVAFCTYVYFEKFQSPRKVYVPE